MKNTFRVIMAFAFLVLSLAANAEAVRMKILKVNDAGELNSTNAVATQADMARIAASNQLAMAEQNAVRDGYNQAIELLGAVATNVAAGTPIAFYSVELSSFDAAVMFDKAKDKVCIIGYEDLKETSTIQGVSVHKWRIRFAFTSDLQTVKPLIGYAQVLDGTARSDWDYLGEDFVESPVAITGTYEDGNGNQYDHCYRMDFWMPTEDQGFSYVKVPNDAVVADGAMIELPNGVRGGLTTNVVWGSKTMAFKGGLFVGVTEVSQ